MKPSEKKRMEEGRGRVGKGLQGCGKRNLHRLKRAAGMWKCNAASRSRLRWLGTVPKQENGHWGPDREHTRRDACAKTTGHGRRQRQRPQGLRRRVLPASGGSFPSLTLLHRPARLDVDVSLPYRGEYSARGARGGGKDSTGAACQASGSSVEALLMRPAGPSLLTGSYTSSRSSTGQQMMQGKMKKMKKELRGRYANSGDK